MENLCRESDLDFFESLKEELNQQLALKKQIYDYDFDKDTPVEKPSRFIWSSENCKFNHSSFDDYLNNNSKNSRQPLHLEYLINQ